MIEILRKVHDKLDVLNGEKGTKEKLCIYCDANKYDGKSGIIHQGDCIMLFIRRYI